MFSSSQWKCDRVLFKILIPPTSDDFLKAVLTVSHSWRGNQWITVIAWQPYQGSGNLLWLFCVSEQGNYDCIVTAPSTTTTVNVRNIGNSSEMWSDGHFVCTQARKKQHLFTWLCLDEPFSRNNTVRKGLHIPTQHCSFRFVNWNWNSAPPVHVADKIFRICRVSLGFW